MIDSWDMNQYWWRVIDTLSEALLIVSKEGRILTVNRAFEELTGFTASEVIGRSCTLLECDACKEFVHQKNRRWCKLFEPDSQNIRKCHCAIKRKDGQLVTAVKNASVLFDEEGRQLGAVETLTDISEIDRLDKKVETLSRQLDAENGYSGIIGASANMKKVFDLIKKAGQSDAPVIIFGESGTGKELVAKAIHDNGQRRNGPFVHLNCAALNESLLESELFGHVKGSFTGALRDRKGRFESADGGDLFLDEIGDIPLSIQIKLLRVLETKQFDRIGEDQPVSADVRIISATHRNLPDLIAKGLFREDLFFRINVIPIHLPPLRERKEDITALIHAFIKRLELRTGKKINSLTQDALHHLLDYHWPGNVRELRSVLEYAFTIAEKGPITRDYLPPHLLEKSTLGDDRSAMARRKGSIERRNLIEALKAANGNQTQAARLLGVNRVTVWNRMRKYGIDLKKEINLF